MYILAFNGSPRKKGATAILLKKALDGAASHGADTELIHLGDLTMRGCQACFSCKKRGGKSYGHCILRDDMTPLYRKIEGATGFIVGSPIYFGAVTAQAKLFIDRLFPYLNYATHSSNLPKKMPAGLVFTMGAPWELVEQRYGPHIQVLERTFTMLFGSAESIVSTDTFHVEDYSKIVADSMEPLVERKRKHRAEVFPHDCEKAFAMGARFAIPVSTT